MTRTPVNLGPAVTAAVEMAPQSTIDRVVAIYVQTRDRIAEIKEGHKAELAPLQETLDKIENALLLKMNKDGLTALPTEAGTAYRQERVSFPVVDFDVFLDWVSNNDQWGMLERRVTKTAVDDYVKSTGMLPPGLNSSREYVCNVRRGKE